MDVAVAVALGDIGVLPQERVRLEDEVVEVEGGGLGEEVLVAFVDAMDDLLVVVGLLEAVALDAEELALRAGDGGEDFAGRELLVVDVELFHRALDERCLVGLIVDGVVLVESEELAVSSKDPGAEGVEGADGHLVSACPHEGGGALPHLAGGLVREGERGDAVGLYAAPVDEVGDAVGYDAGLAAAGACDDEHGAADRFDGLELPGVEG